MIRPLFALVFLASCAFPFGCTTEPAGSGQSGGLSLEEQLALGAADYATYCALCHGDEGEGYQADAANALNNPAFLATATDDFIRVGISRGRPGTPMSAWGEQLGGPLDDAAIDRLVLTIRSWQQGASVDVSGVTVEGEAARGAAQYAARCAGCHGPEGEGGLFMSVANPEFLATASAGYLREAIASGRPGTAMKAYTGLLTEQAIDDLVVLLQSWQQPVNTDPFTPPSTALSDATIHPGGPAPALGDDLYIAADTFKAQLDAGAEVVILDARTPSDYTAGHITGAVSVPFYAAAEVAAELPSDVTVITYCGCPHAESTIAAQALIDGGRAPVHVLDEGYFVWVERGYPITTGPAAGTWPTPVVEPPVADVVDDVASDASDGGAPDGVDDATDQEVGPAVEDTAEADASDAADAEAPDADAAQPTEG